MSARTRLLILRFHAVYLGIASVAAFIGLDLRGLVFGTGPFARVIADAPYSAIGIVEAHGLALILAITLWRVAPSLAWHVTGVAAAALLGVCNLVFWEIFPATDALAVGYVTTALHLSVALAQLIAVTSAMSADTRGLAGQPAR
jgi:hypothetical protein